MGELARRLQGQTGGLAPGFADPNKIRETVQQNIGGGGWGILGDAAREIKDIGVGTGGFLVSHLHDAGVGALDALEAVNPLDRQNADRNYRLDDLYPAIPGAIAEDLSRRYAEPWREGGLGAVLSTAIQNPVSTALDVASVATLGGGLAAKGAGVAAKAPRIAGGLDDLARTGATSSMGARAVDAILPGLKSQRAGLDVPLGGNMTRANQATGRLSQVPLETNPTRRMGQQLVERLRTEPLDNLSQRVSVLDELVDEGSATAGQIAERNRLAGLYNAATEAGIQRIRKPTVSERATTALTKRVVNESGAAFVASRDRLIAAHRDILKNLPKEEVGTFAARALGLEPTPGAGRLSFEEITQAIQGPLDESPRLQRVSEALQPHMERLNQITDPMEAESARRYIEIVGGEPLAAARAGVDDAVTNALDDTRLLNFEKEASVFLDVGGSYTQLFDNLYKPMRVKWAMENGGMKNLDNAPDALQFDEMVKSQGLKAPVYYPQKSVLSNRPSDYLQSKSASGMARRATPSAFRKNEGKNVGAYLRGVKDAFDTDPNEAYARMASEITNFETTMNLVGKLKDEFGLPVSARDEIPEGWALINPNQIRVALRKDRDVRTGAAERIAQGMDMQDSFMETVKEVFSKERTEAELSELFANRGEVFAVPRIVAEQLSEAGKYSVGGAKLRMFFDAPMQMWRSAALYLRGGFYFNNVVGNTAFLGLQGGKVSHQFRNLLSKNYRDGVRNVSKALKVEDEVGSGFFSALEQRARYSAPDTPLGRAGARVSSSPVGKGARSTMNYARRLNEVFEDAARGESFLKAAERDMARRGVKLVGNGIIRTQKRLDQIMKQGVSDSKAVGRWVDEMHETMNNYRALGNFERKIVRRFVAPFWAFYKHAAKTLIRMPYQHPLKAEVLSAVQGLNEEMLAEMGPLPEYVQGLIPVGPGNEPGETRFFGSQQGMNPLGAVLESPLNLLGPVPQAFIEQSTGRDTFTGQQFTAPGVFYPYGSDTPWIRDEETGEVRPLERGFGGLRAPVAPSGLETILDPIPFVDLARDLATGSASRDATGAARIDPRTGQPSNPTDAIQQLLRYLGVSTTDVDLPAFQQRYFQEQSQAQRRLP